MRAHPIAEIFPLLEGKAFDALVADIREHGQREPVIVWEDKILDGRNRWRACKRAGIDPKTKFFRGDAKAALALVLSLNLHRRHLNESQRALVAVEVERMFADAAKERQRAGGREKGKANLPEARQARDDAASALNVSPRLVQDAKKVATKAAPEVLAAVQQGKLAVSVAAKLVDESPARQRDLAAKIDAGAKPARVLEDVRRDKRVEKLASISAGNAPLTLPQRYPIILADPPWRYEQASSESRAIENHYPTMSLDEICALPVVDLATDDAVLFLWTTSPKLEESLRVVAAWSFTYRTCAVWDKEKIGMGYFFRQQHELLLVAVRGEPPHPAPADRVSSIVRAPRGKHSAKPVEVYEIVEAMYPTLPKVEMFCRSPRDGWGAWGNQSGAAA